MNKKIASVMVGMLLIGIVSAGLVPYLSNMISATVTVEGPVFYATSTEGEEKLSINEFIGDETYRQINDIEQEIFWTEELPEIIDFYNPQMELFVKANLIEGIEPKGLRLIFEYVDSNEDVKDICYVDITDIISDDWQTKSKTCNGNSELINVKKFIYRIVGKGDIGTKYTIKIDGETKAQVLGVAT